MFSLKEYHYVLSENFMFMEELKLALLIWCGIGIIACIVVLCLWEWYKKHNPDFLTDKASPQEDLKARKIIFGFLGGFIVYCILFMLMVAYMAYDTIPKALCLLGAVLIAGVIMIVLPVLRKK